MAGNDSYTKLLIHADGDNDGTVFTDSSINVHTVNRVNAVTKTAVKKFGTASAYFDGSNDYLNLSDSDDWNVINESYTVDFWLRFVDKGLNSMLWEQFDSDPTVSHRLYWIGNTYLKYEVFYDSGYIAEYMFLWTTNSNDTWYHVALVRNGTDLKLYVDGTAITPNGTPTAIGSQTIPNISTPLSIGAQYGGSMPLSGYIDEFRWSKGIARWASNFTPPTGEYTATIGGDLSDAARVIIIKESDWSIESNVEESAGNYETTVTADTKLVMAIKSDGEVLGYGDVDPG